MTETKTLPIGLLIEALKLIEIIGPDAEVEIPLTAERLLEMLRKNVWYDLANEVASQLEL